jgi:hypothetical protein
MNDAAKKPPATAITKAENEAALVGTFHTAAAIDTRLAAAARDYHLVSPSTVAGRLPEGCGVALSYVHVQVESETYPIPGGGRGLSKVVLDKIAAASGVSWHPRESRRLDDGRDPNFVVYKAVGIYRAFDGTPQIIQDEKLIDLREGSPTVVALIAKATRPKRGKVERDPRVQLAEARMHLYSTAVTKARLRAIRTLGVKTAYTEEELKKPFVVARSVFTGKTDDPELKRLYGERIADAFLGSTAALFGPPSNEQVLPAQRLAPALPLRQQADPEDVGALLASGDAVDTTGEAVPPAAKPDTSLSLPHKKDEPAKPVREATDRDLEYWRNRLAENLDNGSSKFPEMDEPLLIAIEHEIERRKAVVAASSNPDAPPGAQLPLGGAKPEPDPKQ